MKKFFLLLLSPLLSVLPAAALTVTALHCEHRSNPLGVDLSQPRLGWVLESSRRGDGQSAYQVLVASSQALLDKNKGDLWDSGTVASDATIQIPFAGKPLKSSQPALWKVRVWDAGGKVSRWSSPATWTMGLLAAADWRAKWITARSSALVLVIKANSFTLSA